MKDYAKNKESSYLQYWDVNNLLFKNKYMKDYAKNKESSYLQYWDVNNLFGWAMPQMLLLNKFELIKDTSQFSEDFIKKL